MYIGSTFNTDGLILNLDAVNNKSYSNTTTWKDLSVSGTNASLVGGVTFSTNSLNFNGTNAYANLGQILNFTSSNFSFSYWIKPNTLTTNSSGQGPIMLYKGPYNGHGYYSQIQTNGSFFFATNQSGAIQTTISSPGLISINNWYHIVITRNGSSVRLYLNNVDVSSVIATHSNPASSTFDFRLGIYANINNIGFIYANIKLGNFLVYNKTLLPHEINKIYNFYKPRYL